MQRKPSDPTPRPPRLATLLVRLATPAEERDSLLGDLEQEFREHRLPRGRRAARRWYWNQALRSLRGGLDRPATRLPGGREGDGLMGKLLQDVRTGVRSLSHAPAFTVLTVLTLMLAIGVNSAIFSMLSAVFFTEMPIGNPDTAVFVFVDNPERDVTRSPVSIPDFVDYRERIDALEDLAAMNQRPGILAGVQEPTRILVGEVTANLLPAWGLDPHIGRGFAAGDDAPGAERVAMLSHGMWERRFGGDPDVVGQEVRLDGYPTTIVGVMNRLMEFGDLAAVDVWIPLELDATGDREARGLLVTGRIAPEATLAQAQAQARRVAASLAERHPETNRGWTARVVDFQSGLADSSFWGILTLLVVTVGLVMLLACSNVATMTLARATNRERELAVRAAIGAGRATILRQLVTESVLLSIVSGALGLLVAKGALAGLTWIGSDGSLGNFFEMLTIDRNVLLFTLGVSLLAPVLFGLIPALRSSRTDLTTTLREGGRSSGDRATLRGRRILVASQVSLAIMLMIVAGLLIRALMDVRSLEFTHDPDVILTARIDLPEAKYSEVEQVWSFRARLLERVQAQPGVVRTAWMDRRPLADPTISTSFQIAGAETRTDQQSPHARSLAVTPAYFDMLRLRPLSGRLLGSEDRGDGAPVAVVNAEAVERYWPAADPVGQEIRIGDSDWHRIVGVVSNEVFPDFSDPTVPLIYVPLAQRDTNAAALLVEGTGNPLALTPAIRQAVLDLDPEQPVDDVRTQARILSDNLAAVDAIASLLGAFAFFALVMAGAGIYGVLSFMVASRTREIGVRMALGANRSGVRALVMRNSGTLVLVGVGVGIVGAYGLGRLLATALPEVNPADPVVFTVVGAVLLGVAALAAWIPARRATRVEPVIALKAE